MEIKFIYNRLCSHYCYNCAIYINLHDLSKLYTFDTDKNNDFFKYLNDIYEHESIHYVLDKYEDHITSLKFDLMAKKLRKFSRPHMFRVYKRLGLRFMTRKELKQRMKYK
jgi:hypothetical protein